MAHIKAPAPGKIKSVPIPSQNVEWDPRSKTIADGIQRNVIPTGDKVTVKGTKTRKKHTATWF